MSAHSSARPQEILDRLRWVADGSGEQVDPPVDWRDAAGELYAALESCLGTLEAAGKCRQCGKPLGAYCIECAWPHKRKPGRER
jgi:hypothetical protein